MNGKEGAGRAIGNVSEESSLCQAEVVEGMVPTEKIEVQREPPKRSISTLGNAFLEP
jgi:hypothetical protein